MAGIKTHLDTVDLCLLDMLQRDGRITNADLAKAVQLSPPTVLQRVRALEKAGLIKSYHAILDAERLGLKVTAICMITLALHQEQPIERFRKAVMTLDEVMECYHVSGDFDFLLKILVRDIRAYEQFVREKLSKIKGVGHIRTSFVLGTNKWKTELPLKP